MNAHTPPQAVSPLAVTDPKIRVMLQLAGLRFMITRAAWLHQRSNQPRKLGCVLAVLTLGLVMAGVRRFKVGLWSKSQHFSHQNTGGGHRGTYDGH